jgi:hypothetical protein
MSSGGIQHSDCWSSIAKSPCSRGGPWKLAPSLFAKRGIALLAPLAGRIPLVAPPITSGRLPTLAGHCGVR